MVFIVYHTYHMVKILAACRQHWHQCCPTQCHYRLCSRLRPSIPPLCHNYAHHSDGWLHDYRVLGTEIRDDLPVNAKLNIDIERHFSQLSQLQTY